MTLTIDNRSYARSNILFGRVLPVLIAASAGWTFFSTVSANNAAGVVFPLLMTGFWVVVMVVVYLRRGFHPAVMSIAFESDGVVVHGVSEVRQYDLAEICRFEYEGVHNRHRVPVADAPFPQGGERILVVTLADETELRVRVGYSHDQGLKAIAARLDSVNSLG